MPTACKIHPVGQHLLAVLLVLLPASVLLAQTDSVVISGRISHLTPRLYRQSPSVVITSTNILQADRELAHPAALQPDGSFRVAVPLIYPQEELYFNALRVSTAFLATAGQLTIDLDADSLFIAAIPFRFGGVNAQVNQQFAAYKAYEARNKPAIDGPALSRRIAGFDDQRAFAYLTDIFGKTRRDFAATRPVFPLLTRWLRSIARYDAASFLYDRAFDTGLLIQSALTDSLRPPADRLLTVSHATAMSRFSVYAGKRLGAAPERNVTVKKLVNLLTLYSRHLSAAEQDRLATISQKGGATGSDMRFLNTLVERNGGVIRRLLLFDTAMQQARTEFDSASVDYLEASSLTAAMPVTPIANLPVLRSHIRPMIGDPFLVRSLDEAYARETKDSVAMQQAAGRLANTDSVRGAVEVAPGILVTRNRTSSASELINKVIRNNPDRVLYVLRWTPGEAQSEAQAQVAQRLRDTFSSRDLTLLYINQAETDPAVWLESVVRQKLVGENLYLSDQQLLGDQSPLPPYDAPAYLIGRNGKAQRKNTELPTAYDKLVEQVQQLLQK